MCDKKCMCECVFFNLVVKMLDENLRIKLYQEVVIGLMYFKVIVLKVRNQLLNCD